MSRSSANPRLGALLVGAAALLLLTRLGATDFWAPDEPRYAQVAAELHALEHGPRGLVLLHLNGEPYGQKPPLYYWLAALAGTPLGRVSEGAARLPSALAGIALVALTLGFGTRLRGAASGLLGGALLLTTFEFAYLSRRVQLDVLLALFETLALVAFWRLDRGMGRPRLQIAGMHGALGLAVLTKGPVGLLVPAAVIVTYLLWERRGREIARAFPPWALGLSVAPGLVWIAAAVALAPEGFLSREVGENVFGRFFAGTSHARPFYYYLYQFPVDLLPWTVLAPVVVAMGRRRVFAGDEGDERRRAWRFLLSWVGASLLFFSVSAGKRGLYLLPAFPAAALLCADALVLWLAGRAHPPRSLVVGAAALAALLASAGAGMAYLDPLQDPGASRGIGGAVVAIVAAATLVWRWLSRLGIPALARLAVPLVMVFSVELLAFTVAAPALEAEKSPRPIAEAAAALTPHGEPIGLVGNRALVGGLVYYGDRRVVLLSGPKSIARFFASGGRAIVVRERHIDRVAAVAPVDVYFRGRSGRRALAVVTPGRDEGA